MFPYNRYVLLSKDRFRGMIQQKLISILYQNKYQTTFNLILPLKCYFSHVWEINEDKLISNAQDMQKETLGDIDDNNALHEGELLAEDD